MFLFKKILDLSILPHFLPVCPLGCSIQLFLGWLFSKYYYFLFFVPYPYFFKAEYNIVTVLQRRESNSVSLCILNVLVSFMLPWLKVESFWKRNSIEKNASIIVCRWGCDFLDQWQMFKDPAHWVQDHTLSAGLGWDKKGWASPGEQAGIQHPSMASVSADFLSGGL